MKSSLLNLNIHNEFLVRFFTRDQMFYLLPKLDFSFNTEPRTWVFFKFWWVDFNFFNCRTVGCIVFVAKHLELFLTELEINREKTKVKESHLGNLTRINNTG